MTAATGIRVAILLSEGMDSRGGIGRVTAYFLRDLDRVASDIEVLPRASRLSDRPVIKHLSVPISLASFAFKLIWRRIDIVHINIAPRGSTWRKMIYAKTARLMGRRVLLHLHGSAYDEYFAGLDTPRRALVRRLFQRATRVVVLSDNWKQFAIGQLGVPTERVVEIANGVPRAEALAEKRTGEVPLIVTYGVLGRRKGTDVLLDALAELTRREVPWRAIIGGNGEVAEAIARAEELGIRQNIEFPGWVGEDVVDKGLREADIFVLPSRGENQPVSILEAMARATPVIATNVGGIPLQVDDRRTGLLVEPGDVAGLTDALQVLIADPARRAAYGAAALQRFEENFSSRACAERFADLYREVMQSEG